MDISDVPLQGGPRTTSCAEVIDFTVNDLWGQVMHFPTFCFFPWLKSKSHCSLAGTRPGDPSGGPAEVEKSIRVEMYEISVKTFLASTRPAEVKISIRVEVESLERKSFFDRSA